MTNPGASGHERDEARRREALESLKELRRGGESFAGSAFVRAARRAADHFAGNDAIGPDGTIDRVELWGRRIGRALSLLAVIGLAIYLYTTYLR